MKNYYLSLKELTCCIIFLFCSLLFFLLFCYLSFYSFFDLFLISFSQRLLSSQCSIYFRTNTSSLFSLLLRFCFLSFLFLFLIILPSLFIFPSPILRLLFLFPSSRFFFLFYFLIFLSSFKYFWHFRYFESAISS